jgi:adenylate cyclase
MFKGRIVNFFYNWSIQLKLVLIISVIIIFSITAIIYIATYFFKKDNEVRIKEKNLEITELIGSKTRSDISNIVRSALETAQAIQFGNLRELRFKTSLQSVGEISGGEEFVAFYIYQVNGNQVTPLQKVYNPIYLNEKKIDRKNVDAIVSKNLSSYSKSVKGITVVRNSSIDSEPLMGLSHPFRTGQGSTFLLVVSKMDTIRSSFKSSGISDNFMLTDDGVLLAHTKMELVSSFVSYKDESIFQKIEESPINNAQVKYTDKEGKVYIASFKKIGVADLVVVTTVSEDKAMEEVNNIQRRNFFLMIIILNLSILVVLIYSKKLTRPILKLVEASKKIEKGDFHVEIEESSGDEIGVLTRSFTNMAKGLSERDKIKDAFGKFVNSEIAEKALQGEIELGGSRRECTIFFSDIRNFTSISEGMEPEDVVEFLNKYMTKMVGCVNAKSGIVDKFIGDSIMAVWGAINTTKNDTESAIDAALLMRSALLELNEKRKSTKQPFIRIGIGINTGAAIAGQIGSEERLEFTVIGDSVNLASRIEALNKDFDTDILVSESSYEKVKTLYSFVKMKSISVKGKKKPQVIYAVLGRKNDPKAPKTIAALRMLIIEKKPGKKAKVKR